MSNGNEAVALSLAKEGDHLLAQQRVVDALAAYDTAVGLAPHQHSLRYKRALARAQAGRLQEAAAELAMLIEMEPSNTTYTTAMKQMQETLSQKRAQASSEPHVVLIVDDDEDITRAVADRVQEEGWRARRAHNLQEALQLGMERPFPSIIVYDYCVGDITGLEVRHELSFRLEQQGQAEPPYVLLTARDSPFTEQYAVKQGARAYVLKSQWLHPEHGLAAAVRMVLHQ